MASVNAGNDQKAHFIDEVGLQECTVDVTAAFDQQTTNPEVLTAQAHSLSEVNRGRTGNDVGDAFVPQQKKDNLPAVVRSQHTSGGRHRDRRLPIAVFRSYRPIRHTTLLSAQHGPVAVWLGCSTSIRKGSFSAKCRCIVVRSQTQPSPSSFVPVVSYSLAFAAVARHDPDCRVARTCTDHRFQIGT
jgi:hypothetical protein